MYNNEFLKELISANKMNLRTAHEEIGLSRPVSTYDNSPPSCREIELIADYFNISMDSLFGRNKRKTREAIVESLKFDSEYPYNLIEHILGRPIDWKIEEKNVEGLEWAMSTLKEKETQMLLGYFRDGNTLREVGELYGVTQERVRQVIAKALRKLRHPSKYKVIIGGPHSIEEVDKYAEEIAKVLEKREKKLDEREAALEDKERLLNEKIEEFNRTGHREIVSGIISLDLEIEDMNLSVRAYNCLARFGLKNLGDIVALLENEPETFIKIRNLGRKSAEEIVLTVNELLGTEKYYRIYQKALAGCQDIGRI